MSQENELTLNVVSEFKAGEGGITVQHTTADGKKEKVTLSSKKISEGFPFKSGEEKILEIDLGGEGKHSAKDRWFGLPSMFNYEFFPEVEEDKKGNIEISQEGRQKVIKIPKGSPLKWKLKIKGKPRAPLSSLTGTEDTVKPGGGKDGTLTHERSLPEAKVFKEKEKANLKDAELLKDFLKKTEKNVLTGEDREKIIDQALTLISEVYVHLTLKKTRHAVDPIRSLERLKSDALLSRLNGEFQLSDRAFHNRMISIFNGLKDLHTQYILPSPYKDRVAFLPFLIEEFWEGEEGREKKKYLVSKVFSDVEQVIPSFERGVIISHWNGIPIERAVALNGERNAGSNESARIARGLEWMTIRPLTMTLPPDEEWVDITFQKDNREYTLRFNWYVAKYPLSDISGIDPVGNGTAPEIRGSLGVNNETEYSRRMKKSLYFQENNPPKGIKQVPIKLSRESKMNGIFAFGKTPDGRYGYIRIYSFDVRDADAFVEEFADIIKELPKDGLIIDVRGNGGGLITAGEKLLQVFTSKEIERETFQFKATSLMLQFCMENDWLEDKWKTAIANAIASGDEYSTDFQLESDEDYHIDIKIDDKLPFKYTGKVVLIIDALCYSTTDIFAAGFQDNELGKILGTDENTGAGGANVWTHKFLDEHTVDSSKILTFTNDEFKNCEFRVAVRRSKRVGDNKGRVLEDFGVRPDDTHKMTMKDIMECNVDLIKKAVEILDKLNQ